MEEARLLPRLRISKELGKDVENVAKGVFSPLEGFLVEEDFDAVLHQMRLTNDLPWPIPIVLDASHRDVERVKEGDDVALAVGDADAEPMALIRVEDIYSYNKRHLAKRVFGTDDPSHPGVAGVYKMKDVLIGGKIDLLKAERGPFERYSLTPLETRVLFKEKGWRTVAGFQTRNVPHLGHEYIQKTALSFVDGIFVNPIVGRKKEGDFRDEVILDAYETLIGNYYLKDNAVLAVLETEMRYAGPREAIFHAIVRKNFGCTHFIVGRDHAGVGKYYGPYEAQEIFDEFPDLGVTPIFFRSFFHCRKCGGVENERTCPHGNEHRVYFSGTGIREMLEKGRRPSEELMRPEVADAILKYGNPFVGGEG